MMNIIVASRLRGKAQPEPNTFIGNVADVIPDAATLAQCSSQLFAYDIQSFQIQGNNIKCFISKDYTFNQDQWFGGTTAINSGRVNMTYFIDLEGKVTFARDYTFSGGGNRFVYLPKITNVENSSFQNIKGENIIVMPKLTSLGNTLNNDGVFVFTNGEFYLNKFLETVNNGSPDGDIKPVTIYRDLNNLNQTTAPTAPTISVDTIGGFYVELNISQPTHVNALKYALVFVDGFFQDVYDINNVYALNLQEQTSYNIKVIIADEFFNISPYSNTINVTTQPFTISQNTIGGTYVLLDENHTLPIETKTVDVYVNGVLNNTITNASKGSVYAVNLDELTNYDIYLVIEENQSNTINVTTTTIDTQSLFQNAVAYYKLDETGVDAIDVVNGYNGTLFGGVTQGVAGKIGTAYSFDGVDGYVNIGDLNINVSNAYSFSAWVKGSGQIIGRDDDNKRFWQFRIMNDAVNFIRFNSLNDIITNLIGGSVNINEYNHVVSTFSISNGSKIYLNGVEVGYDSNLTQNQTGIGATILIGATPRNSVTNLFNGSIDEVSIYENYELQIQEISDLYNNGIGTTI